MAKAQFDRDEVIEKTIELFWTHGFSGSSMQQVVKATGLKPGSIYLAFGSKEGLFKEAIESYSKKSLILMKTTLDNAPTIGEGICQILLSFVKDADQEQFRSCFLMKTQMEMVYNSSDLDSLAGDLLKERELLFQEYLEREYDRETSKKRAASLMLHIYGLRFYGFQENATESMILGLKEGLSWLPWDKF